MQSHPGMACRLFFGHQLLSKTLLAKGNTNTKANTNTNANTNSMATNFCPSDQHCNSEMCLNLKYVEIPNNKFQLMIFCFLLCHGPQDDCVGLFG